jgi:hypothetical protein
MTSVKEKLKDLFQEPDNGAGLGMRLSLCRAEENPFNSQATIESDKARYPEVE